jgi:hypothetical protein
MGGQIRNEDLLPLFIAPFSSGFYKGSKLFHSPFIVVMIPLFIEPT